MLFFQELPGLDFERYLQPSLRCSLSPRKALSPMVDVEMESPRSQTEDLQEPGRVGDLAVHAHKQCVH